MAHGTAQETQVLVVGKFTVKVMAPNSMARVQCEGNTGYDLKKSGVHLLSSRQDAGSLNFALHTIDTRLGPRACSAH
jgi:hypothetical protein